MNWFMLANELIQHFRNTSIATAVIYANETKSHISQVFEKANFPHFRHDNSADIQYLKFKLSGQVVTPLLLGMN